MTVTNYQGRHRHDERPDADQWRIRLLISKTNLPHTGVPKHGQFCGHTVEEGCTGHGDF